MVRSLLRCGIALSLLCGSAEAADPQPYAVILDKTGDAALDSALKDSSSLISLQKTAPVGPFALVARAQDDVARFVTALRSFGYYKGTAAITIDGHKLEDPGLPALLDQAPAGAPVPVAVTFDLGPLFHLRRVTLTGNVPPDVREKFGLESGQPAIASAVLAGRDRVLTALQEDGYALAKVDPLVVTLIADANSLDVSEHAVPGPQAQLGPITFAGLKDVNPAFVRRRLLLQPGQRYDPAALEKARQDLASIGVFSAVRIEPAAHLDPNGQLPLTIHFTERKQHVVDLSAAYSTDLGGSVSASWSNRNLLGNAETLTFSAALTELGGSDSKQPGYNLGAVFTKPDWLARDQTLQFNVTAVKEYLQAYDRTAFIAGGSVTRKLDPHLSVSIGLTGTREKVTQEDVSRNYTLAAVPLTAKYDTTDSLFEPTHGFRASAAVTPTESFGGSGGTATFVITQLSGSTYFDFAAVGLGAPGRSVLALRALLGSAGGASQFQLPPDQRFYAGGSGTIRGYKYQVVGPQFPDRNPQGGTSIDAATIEFRQRILGSFGAVVFADAGQVGVGATPFNGALRVGAGVGARYYPPIGPIRLDFALPLIRQPGNDTFEVYIGIGEAF